MKKVLILVNSDIVIYNFKKELLYALKEKGYEVYISLPFGEKTELLKETGVNLIETKIDRRGVNPFKDYILYRSYLKTIKKIRPEFIMTFTVKCNIYGGKAAKKEKIPYYCSVTVFYMYLIKNKQSSSSDHTPRKKYDRSSKIKKICKA